LRIIIEQCVNHDESFKTLSVVCSSLTDYAVITRYPVGEDAVNEHDMNEALKNAAAIMEFTKSKLKVLGYK
jgi:hypothetical protein